jgi:REP element-mobilizing transposase RayT
VRKRYDFVVVGYVVMPEHIHLLISEPQKKNPSTVMQALKLLPHSGHRIDIVKLPFRWCLK